MPRSKDGGGFSGPLSVIAVVSIALGVLVMVMAVCILRGFQGEIASKVVGFGSHLTVSNFASQRRLRGDPRGCGQHADGGHERRARRAPHTILRHQGRHGEDRRPDLRHHVPRPQRGLRHHLLRLQPRRGAPPPAFRRQPGVQRRAHLQHHSLAAAAEGGRQDAHLFLGRRQLPLAGVHRLRHLQHRPHRVRRALRGRRPASGAAPQRMGGQPGGRLRGAGRRLRPPGRHRPQRARRTALRPDSCRPSSRPTPPCSRGSTC